MTKYEFLETLLNEIKRKPGFSNNTISEIEKEKASNLIAQLYSSFFDAVSYVNHAFEINIVSIDNLSVEIFKLILNSEQLNACFYLISKDKYVFVFEESTGQVSFFGRYRNYNDKDFKVNRNFVQLFKLDCVLEKQKIRLKDNTGNEISTEEVIFQILKWLLL